MAEVLKPVETMKDTLLIYGLFAASLVAMVGLVIATRLTVPLTRLSQVFQTFGTTRSIEKMPYIDRPDEIGDMARVFDKVTNNIGTYIADREKAETDAAAKETQLRMALDNLPGAMAYTDADMKMVVCNDRYREIYDFPEEMVRPGRYLPDIFRYLAERDHYGPGDVDAFVADRTESLRNPSDKVFEDHTSDGHIHEVRRRRVEGGGTVTVITDVTNQRRAEEALAAKEAQLRVALDHMSGGLFMIDKDFNYQVASPSFIEIYEIPAELVYPGAPLKDTLAFRAERGDYGPGNPKTLVRKRLQGYLDGGVSQIEDTLPNGRVIEVFRAPTPEGGTVAVFNDITERKKAEIEFRKSEEQFRGVFESGASGMALLSMDGTYVKVNRKFCEIVGYTEEELYQKTWRDITHPEEIAKVEAYDQEVAAGKNPDFSTERRLIRKDGTIIWTRLSSAQIRDHEGVPRYIFSSNQDITELKAAEERLAEKEAQLRMAMDNMPGAIFVVDENLNLLLINDRYGELYGHPKGFAVAGKSMEDILRFEMEQGILIGEGEPEEILEQRLASLRSKKSSSFEDITPDGRVTHIRRKPAPGNHMVTVITDITEQKEAEAEISRQRKNLHHILENVAQGIAKWSPEQTLVSWNDRYQKLLDLPNELMEVGRPLQDFTRFVAERGDYGEGDPNELSVARIAALFCGKEIRNELSIGDAKTYDSLVQPTDDGGIVITYTDITERKRGEEELRVARDAAEEATKAKAAFLATMSHEIRTPMTGVIGMVDLLTQSKLDDDQRQMMRTVRDSAYALLTIINDILDFSKIEAGKLELEAIPFSIRDTVEGMAETLGPNANNKGIRINIHVDPDIPDAVLGDQVRIRQILFNIGGNAVKFTEEGRVLIRACRMPSRSKKKAIVRFEIVDSGIGISKEAQASLFQEFSQAESSTTRRFGGTGLGLSICQRLTEMMDGKIEVESEFGKGSTFIVTLTFPIAEDHAIKSDGHDLAGLNVLLVSDDTEVSELDAKYLRHWNADVTTFGEIEETKTKALDAASQQKPFDIIVLGSAWSLETLAAHIEAMRNEDELAETRFVLMTKTRIKAERKEIPNAVYVGSDPLRRAAFIRAVAVAAGRASPDISDDEDEIAVTTAKAPTIKEAEAAGTLILVAEDNMTNQTVIARQLNLLGYAADMADDGKQALAAIKSKRYAVLLTDCHMPEMDGYELTQEIRKIEKDGDVRLPIIAITASVLAAEIDRCYEAGMDDSLAKPLEMPKLKATLRKWMPAPSGDPKAKAKSKAKAKAKARKDLPAEDTTDKPEAKDGGDGGDGPIDPTALKSVFGDDEATFKEILKEFVEPATSNVGEIAASFTDRSADGVAKAAHKLKSSARSVGANELADLCQTLETAGKAEDWDEIDKAAPRLPSAIEKVVEYINNL